MKLERVATGQKLIGRLKLGAATVVTRERAADILRVLLYRPELFGRHFGTYVQSVLRGASGWTVGERELMAAMVSQTNSCAFCYANHRAMAEKVMGAQVVEQALDAPESAPIREELRAALLFVRKLTAAPEAVGHSDVEALRRIGLGRDDVETVVHIATIFNLINRVADALGFEVPSAGAMSRMSNALLKHGYDVV